MLIQDVKSRRIVVGAISGEDVPITDLVSLVGVQRLNVKWSHDVGVRPGLTIPFLQAWYNRPVEIEISGESYIGAFGDSGIGGNAIQQGVQNIVKSAAKALESQKTITTDQYKNRIPAPTKSFTESTKNVLNKGKDLAYAVPKGVAKLAALATTSTNKIQNTVQKFFNSLAPANDSGVSPHIDTSIGTLKSLVSQFNYGPFASPVGTFANIRHVLIIENDPGKGGSVTPYFIFYGFIRDFEYTEAVEAPFVYDYTVRFVGVPQLKDKLTSAIAQVGKEQSAFALTVTSSGVLLRQGIGI